MMTADEILTKISIAENALKNYLSQSSISYPLDADPFVTGDSFPYAFRRRWNLVYNFQEACSKFDYHKAIIHLLKKNWDILSDCVIRRVNVVPSYLMAEFGDFGEVTVRFLEGDIHSRILLFKFYKDMSWTNIELLPRYLLEDLRRIYIHHIGRKMEQLNAPFDRVQATVRKPTGHELAILQEEIPNP